jgi:hypothetical protein
MAAKFSCNNHSLLSLKAINAKRIGVPIPEGWAVDKDGQNITDPNFVYGMLPLGGVESTCKLKSPCILCCGLFDIKRCILCFFIGQ